MTTEHKTESKIIDVLGEEMFNVCLENPTKAHYFSWLLTFSIAEFDKANGINCEISSKLLEIEEILGLELCSSYFKNPQGLDNLLNMLCSYVETYNETQEMKSKINDLLERMINSSNLEAKIAPLIWASESNDESIILSELLKRTEINYVRELLRANNIKLNKDEALQLWRLAEWLGEDQKVKLKKELYSLFKHKRDLEIIRKRTGGATLEETSTAYKLTHEGVRLIEKKFQGRFNSYLAMNMPHYILYAFGKNQCYITIEELKELLGDISDIFVYYLKLSNCSTAHWSEELNGFIIGEGSWYEQLNEYKKGLPDIIDGESIDDFIIDTIDNFTLPIGYDDTKRLLLLEYSFSGKVYLKNKMSLSRMYYAVLEKYYPDGIKLYDDSEAIRFRSYVHELFGDVYLPENNRAIAVRLSDLTILCDKGKRILPSGIKIPFELLRKIHDAIVEFDKNEILFRTLFEEFKDELLENSNVTNKYFLQGVLRKNFSHEFNFTRYAIRKLSCSPSPAK